MSMAASAFMCACVCVGDLGAKRAGTSIFCNEISFVECSDYKMIFVNHEMMSARIFFPVDSISSSLPDTHYSIGSSQFYGYEKIGT